MDISLKPKIFVSITPPQTSLSQDFMLSKINHIPCAYCRKEMTTPKYLREMFGDEPEISTDCIEKAREIGYLLSSEKQQILNMLTQTQTMYGLTTDNQIIRNAIIDAKKYIRRDILQRFNDIVNIVKKSSAERQNSYLLYNEERCRNYIVRKADYDELLKFVRGETFLNIHPKSKTFAEINEIIKDIEEEGRDKYPEAYMVRRALYKTPSEFYIDLFEKTLASIDHVIPKSEGGANNRKNFLAVCRECNEKKGSTPLPVFIAADLRVKSNIEHQIKFLKMAIPKFIAERKLHKEYAKYPEEISESLQMIMNGKLNLIG